MQSAKCKVQKQDSGLAFQHFAFFIFHSSFCIELSVVKVPSTPHNQALGVLEGLEKIAREEGMALEALLARTDYIAHGTTVATNTMVEYNGAATGLITTQGFRDILEFRRGYKESIFDPRLAPPPAIVPRRRRIGVEERIDLEGRVLVPLKEEEVREALRQFREAGVESVAVCLLFSFLNPAHERRVADLVAQELPGAHLSLSHEVLLPGIREFERASTTAVNAYVAPRLGRYLQSLEESLFQSGYRHSLLVMQSNGGVMNVEYLSRKPVHSLLSGPAGGVIGGADPGPICYGKGGEEPTVTDANLLLGYLNPENFLGGEMRLEAGRAAGLLSADLVISKARSYVASSEEADLNRINQLFASMMAEVQRELTGQNLVSSQVLFRRSIDFHYQGQTHEITNPLDGAREAITAEDLRRCIARYHELHERLHTFSNPQQPVELMVLRLEGVGLTWKPPLPPLEPVGEGGPLQGQGPSGALKGVRKAYFEELGGFQEVPYDGNRVQCGNLMEGPCIVEEPTTALVVYPGQRAVLTQFGNYEITPRGIGN